MDNWQFIKNFYSQNGVFLCARRGRGKGSCEIEVHNILFHPASTNSIKELERATSRILSPSHRQFLILWNGGILFTQKCVKSGWIFSLIKFILGLIRPLDKNRLGYECGFQLYSTAEIPGKHKEVISWLKELIEEPDSYLFDESNQEEKSSCKEWLDNILVIGEELNSGNYIAIDFNRPKINSDFPIIFMEHETPLSYVDTKDDAPIIAATVDELLVKAAENPADFLMKVLGATATYSDGNTDHQWYPELYRTKELSKYPVQWPSEKKREIEECNPTLSPDVLLKRNINLHACLILKNEKSSLNAIDNPYTDDMIDDYTNSIYFEIQERSSSSKKDVNKAKLLLSNCNELLKKEDIEYVKAFASLECIVNLCHMPGGCKSWASLNALYRSLRESIIEHLLDEESFNEELSKIKSNLLSQLQKKLDKT